MNLVDFDALWGHRRNVEGYAKELEKFDEPKGLFISADLQYGICGRINNHMPRGNFFLRQFFQNLRPAGQDPIQGRKKENLSAPATAMTMP